MRKVLVVVVLIAALGLSSCSARGGVSVTLDEWSVEADPASAESGEVTFTARNRGDVAHQLIVLQTTRRFDRLPVRKGVARLDVRGITKIGGIPSVAEDDAEALSLTLRAGSYVLICNIASHYSNGMRARFRAT
jgi:uncharacterized cupredoxin-like copper-binding protein